MSIESNIAAKQAAIDMERATSPTGDSAIANDLQVKAVAAIYGGTFEWEIYMREFATDADELGRLQPETNDSVTSPRNIARTYLVGNGICGPASPGGTELSYTVGDLLDY